MRNDLALICMGCRIRRPSDAPACPLCASPTGSTLPSAWRQELATVRPLRDALLWIPAALLLLVAAVCAIHLGADGAAQSWKHSGALAGGVFVYGTLAGFAAVTVILGLCWLPWAGLVALIAWLTGRRGRAPVRVIFFPVASPQRPAWFPSLQRSHAFKPTWRTFALAVAAVLAIELVCEIAAPSTRWGDKSAAQALMDVALFVALQAFMFVFLMIPIGIGASAVVLVAEHTRRLALVLSERRRIDARRDFAGARAALAEGREAVSGRARTFQEPLIAPLSGQRCLAFRLRGKASSFELDDADVAPFVVLRAHDEVLVRGEHVVVALPEPRVSRITLDAEQRERLRALFRARNLPDPPLELELGETLLCEADDVVVHGAESHELAPGEGYRERISRRVSSDEDGKPLWIEPAQAARSESDSSESSSGGSVREGSGSAGFSV